MNICPQNIRLKEHQEAVVNRETIVKYGGSYEEKKVGRRSSSTLTEIQNRQRESKTIQQDKRIKRLITSSVGLA